LKYRNEVTDRLFQGILTLKNLDECYRFFEDACTIKEILEIAGRFEVACQLTDNRNYQQISKDTGVSTTTISRVNRSLQYGGGGYRTVIERLKEEEVQ
jgi:TrpR-related protein YerC/YecD